MGVRRSGRRICCTPFELRTRRSAVRIRHKRSLRRASLVEEEEEEEERCVDSTSLDKEISEDNDSVESGGEEREGEHAEVSSSDEGEGEELHSRLLSAINELGSQRRRSQRSEATPTVSQFQLSSTSGEEVKIGDLLHGVGEEGRGVASLRRQLASASNRQLLPPATKQEVEKAHRALAYSAACEDVSKWLPVVTHNRKADHLSFPLQEETVPAPSLSYPTPQPQAVSELERAVRDVVDKSEDVMEATDAELTAAERAELVRVMGEEWRERVRESRKWRRLMSQYEAKCQRERRIKSRRFHKVQRRRREKASETGESGDGVTGEEEKAERLRATERMTLRHSRQGKWAREVLARKKRSPATVIALSEHRQRGRTLSQHHPLPAESEDDESGHSGAVPPTDTHPTTTTVHDCHGNPWLQPVSPPLLLNSSMASEEDMEDALTTTVSQPRCSAPPPTSKLHPPHDSQKTKPTIDPTAFIMPQKEGVALGVANQQLLHVHEAFAGDDVVAEFEREKETLATTQQDTPPLVLPGWGVWGGEGTKQSKKNTVKPKVVTKPRSDRELDHVIISDHSNTKINKHLVKKLPWPFSSTQQFNRSQATPIGRHWNSEVVYREMVRPQVETAVGVVIPPIKLTDDVQDFMKRHNQDKKFHRRSQDKKNHKNSRQV